MLIESRRTTNMSIIGSSAFGTHPVILRTWLDNYLGQHHVAERDRGDIIPVCIVVCGSACVKEQMGVKTSTE